MVDNGWTDNLAVLEPSKGMLETFNKNFPQIKNQILGSSYKIPLQDNSIDAVIIAQGFHWFADLDSLKEIYRVLKPQGKLGLIWNFDYASTSQDSSVADSEYFNAGTQYYNTLNFNLDTNEKCLNNILTINNGTKLQQNLYMVSMLMCLSIDTGNGDKF